jgi:hypothetical protein
MNLLDKNQYHKALPPLLSVTVNHLFARSVIEKHVSGEVYTDNGVNPGAFYVVHPYGMSLLFGMSNDINFQKSIISYILNKEGQRQRIEWMQAYPSIWNKRIEELTGDLLVASDSVNAGKVEVHTRANFKFNTDKYRSFRKQLKTDNLSIVRTDKDLFEKMEGAVVPKKFWDNAVDFCNKGVGFTTLLNGKPACTAYSAYIFAGQLELGIETLADHRGKGLALLTCASLIDYCLENSYEPVWSCRLENTASYCLAQKLGFEPTVTLPFYRLPV